MNTLWFKHFSAGDHLYYAISGLPLCEGDAAQIRPPPHVRQSTVAITKGSTPQTCLACLRRRLWLINIGWRPYILNAADLSFSFEVSLG